MIHVLLILLVPTVNDVGMTILDTTQLVIHSVPMDMLQRLVMFIFVFLSIFKPLFGQYRYQALLRQF